MRRLLYVVASVIVAAGWAAEQLRRWWQGIDDARLGEIE